jgi:hypothetical protein
MRHEMSMRSMTKKFAAAALAGCAVLSGAAQAQSAPSTLQEAAQKCRAANPPPLQGLTGTTLAVINAFSPMSYVVAQDAVAKVNLDKCLAAANKKFSAPAGAKPISPVKP